MLTIPSQLPCCVEMLAMIIFPHSRDTGHFARPYHPFRQPWGGWVLMRAAGSKPAEGIRQPMGQTGEIIEGKQVTGVGGDHQLASARAPAPGLHWGRAAP
jgi:hypothetical protein